MAASSTTIANTPRVWRLCLAVAVFAAGASVAFAQTGSAPSETGFQPNRDYLELQPFEQIDTASGNIVLTFADLVLPGNSGHELRFDRVFNNRVTDPSSLQWRFGISGVPMQVVEKARPSGNTQISPTIQGERFWAPFFPMLDGSYMEMTFVETPDSKKSATQRWVQSPTFVRYDRDLRNLHFPDGTVAHYTGTGAAPGDLDRISDPFGNTVTLSRSAGFLRVVQSLGPSGGAPSRTVDILMNDATKLPNEMSYDDGTELTTWIYTYDSTVPSAPGRLATVQPPLGPAWAFTYEPFGQGKLLEVTTPQGGTIAYTYRNQTFPVGPNPTDVEDVIVIHTRTVGGREVTPATWEFAFLMDSVTAAGQADVTLPLGATVTYSYISRGEVLAGGWALQDRILKSDGIEVEREHREYINVAAGRVGNSFMIPELRERRITRGGRVYTTTYTYRTQNFGDFHRPETVTETGAAGELSRSTTFEYAHQPIGPSSPSVRHLLGLPVRERVTAMGQTVEKSWGYQNMATGFRTSETLYGITSTFAPDAVGNIRTETKGNQKVTTFDYSYGQMSRSSTPGVVVERVINPDGTVRSETIAGQSTTYEYDRLSRLRRIQPTGANPTIIDYDEMTHATQTIRRGNGFTATTFDGFGRQLRTEDSLTIKTRIAYDKEGRKIYESLPFFGSFEGSTDIGTQFEYDTFGRVTREVNADSTFQRRQYDGNTINSWDEKNRQTVLARKAFGHPDDVLLTGVTDAEGQQWNYQYDAIGQLLVVAGPESMGRTWVYDQQMPTLLRSETTPESGTVNYTTYDGAGVLKSKRDAKGTIFTYEHDGNDRLTKITAGTEVTTITYAPGTDNRSTVTTDNVASVFGYEATTGRLQTHSELVDGKGFDVQLAYDGNDNVTELTYPSGRKIGYEYDSENRITRVFNGYTQQTYASGFSYHVSGGLEQYQGSNGVATSIAYHPQRHWVTSITSGSLQLGYQHDAVGNVETITDSRPGMNQTFTYDEVDRLRTANSSSFPSLDIQYDGHGNRRVVNGVSHSYQPGTFRLQSTGSLAMGYDLNGNLDSGPQATFTYTPHNLMRSSTVAGTTVNYSYGADDWRVKKAVTGGATTYFVRGPSGQLLTEWKNTGQNADVRDHVYAGSRLIGVFSVTQPAP